jgi:PKD repeat protein
MTTYYVNKSTGSDQNSTAQAQSSGTPWESISHALSQVGSGGDTIIVADGTYYEWVNISTDNVTLQAANQYGAVIDGGWTFPSSYTAGNYPSLNWNGRIQVTASGVTIDGFKVQNTASRGINVNGAKDDRTDNVTIQNCWVYRCLVMGLRVEYSDDFVFQDNIVEEASLQVHWWLSGVVRTRPVVLQTKDVDGGTVDGNTIKNSGGEGLVCGRGSENVTLTNNISINNPLGGYSIYNTNCTFDSNVFWFSDDVETYSGIRSNWNGFAFRDESSNGTANPGDWESEFQHSSGVIFINNLIVGAKNDGIQISNLCNLDGFVIANNTIVDCPKGINVSAPNTDRVSRNTVIESNVFECNKNVDKGRTGITWRNNVWRATPATSMRGSGDVYSSALLVDWDAARTQTVDTTDYKLTASSPAIGQARSNANVTDDYYGASRGTDPDCGFHQYDGVVAPDVTAAFTASTLTPDAGAAVTLTDTSSASVGSIDAWSWKVSLDDGQTKTEFATMQNTSYTPVNVGRYIIYLTATDTGNAVSDTTLVTLTVGNPTVDPENPDTGTGGSFSCSGNLLSNPSLDTDKTGWTDTNMTTSRTVDPTDATNYVLKATSVTSFPAEFRQSGFTITSGTDYVISFDAWTDSSSGYCPIDIHLVDHSSGAYLADPQSVDLDNNVTRYSWTVSATATATSNARFRVRLRHDKTCYFDDFCVKPYSEVAAAFTISDSTPSIGDAITFTDTSTGDPYAWAWRVNGEIISTSAGPVSWTVPDEGVYTVQLTVAGGDNTDSTTDTVTTEEWRDSFQRGLRRGTRWGMM